MSDTVHELHIAIDEWPSRDDLQDFSQQNDSHQKIADYIALEFDTIVHFKVGEVDLLGGYPESFFLPLHAFARELSRAIKTLDREGEASCRIYLQQYEVNDGDAAHTLGLKRDEDHVQLTFAWGGEVETPEHLRFDHLLLDYSQFRAEVIEFLDTYARKTMMLLTAHAGFEGEAISSLFESF